MDSELPNIDDSAVLRKAYEQSSENSAQQENGEWHTKGSSKGLVIPNRSAANLNLLDKHGAHTTIRYPIR